MVVRSDLPIGDQVGVLIQDSNGDLQFWDGTVYSTIDVSADFEVIGTTVDQVVVTPTTAIQQSAVAVSATERIYLYKIYLTPAASCSNVVGVTLGATQIGAIQWPRMGGQYVILSASPDYVLGATGADLNITAGTDATMTLVVMYELEGGL